MRADPAGNPDLCRDAVWISAGLFCVLVSWTSYARWAGFEYRTFDLAFYVQALWQLLHGHWGVSLLRVPLLGNHMEPIVFLLVPVFAIFQHPMTLVVVQNALLAALGPIAYRTARELGLTPRQAALLAIALLITPATAFIALHEFHPEALAAPFLVLMLRARIRGSHREHWLWFLAVLACKENMALILIPYCAVYLVLERRRSWAELSSWYLWPLIVSAVWFIAATKFILPALNSGNVDYLGLYDRLGSSPGAIVRNFFTAPGRAFAALAQSISHGNLLTALLLPFLALPLYRPRWLVIATPILLQHLLSWRSSEWMIYFHYAAPLLPLFWFGLAETVAVAGEHAPKFPQLADWLCGGVLAACLAAQLLVGPAPLIFTTMRTWPKDAPLRERQRHFISQIPADASVTAGLPYLSHLAMRPELYSLHHVLKGLRTLSRTRFEPPAPTDFVFINYADSATFDAAAGYYHPTMRTNDDRIIPSSDRLLHDLLAQRRWISTSSGALTLLRQTEVSPMPPDTGVEAGLPLATLGSHTRLLTLTKDSDELTPSSPVVIHTQWLFDGERDLFPWMELVLTPADGSAPIVVTRGLSAPEARSGQFSEQWTLPWSSDYSAGDYSVQVFFFDNARRAWAAMAGGPASPALCPALPLGTLTVKARGSSAP